MKDWLYGTGRVLQLIGLLLLPLAIAGEISPNKDLNLSQSLALTAAGLCVFGLGYALQQYARPSE